MSNESDGAAVNDAVSFRILPPEECFMSLPFPLEGAGQTQIWDSSAGEYVPYRGQWPDGLQVASPAES